MSHEKTQKEASLGTDQKAPFFLSWRCRLS